MTTKELEGIYATACAAKGYTPNDGQFKIWKQTLGWCERKDLEAALVEFFTNNTGFPMPAELKTLSESARRQRVSKLEQKTELVMWRCPECGIGCSGFPPVGDTTPRTCRGLPRTGPSQDEHGNRIYCGAILEEKYRGELGNQGMRLEGRTA